VLSAVTYLSFLARLPRVESRFLFLSLSVFGEGFASVHHISLSRAFKCCPRQVSKSFFRREKIDIAAADGIVSVYVRSTCLNTMFPLINI